MPTFIYITAWIGERMRELAQIPINLIRDLPVRLERVVCEIIAGIFALIAFPSQLRQQTHKNIWLKAQIHPLLAWGHRLNTALFDLLGLPEVCQFLMHLVMPTTPLTPTEIATIASVLGEHAVRWQDVRVAEGGFLTFIFKHNGGRGFATWHTIHLASEGRHTRKNFSLLVHELTHVYQYETIGTRYITEAIQIQAKMGQACYRYGGVAGLEEACRVKKRYAEYNREAQAQIAQEYYILKNAGNNVTMYEPYIAELQAAKF